MTERKKRVLISWGIALVLFNGLMASLGAVMGFDYGDHVAYGWAGAVPVLGISGSMTGLLILTVTVTVSLLWWVSKADDR